MQVLPLGLRKCFEAHSVNMLMAWHSNPSFVRCDMAKITRAKFTNAILVASRDNGDDTSLTHTHTHHVEIIWHSPKF